MVGVQDNRKCPKCGYKEASYEYQTRGGTEWLFCNRCGYEYHTVAVIDQKKSARITKEIKDLYKKGDYVEAMERLGWKVGGHWTRESMKEQIEHDLESGIRFFKLTRDGKWIHRSYSSGGNGAYSYMPTDKSINDNGKKLMVGGSGQYPADKKEQAKLRKWLCDLRDKYHCDVSLYEMRDGKPVKSVLRC